MTTCYSIDELSRMAGERWAREDAVRTNTARVAGVPGERGRARPDHGSIGVAVGRGVNKTLRDGS